MDLRSSPGINPLLPRGLMLWAPTRLGNLLSCHYFLGEEHGAVEMSEVKVTGGKPGPDSWLEAGCRHR